MYCVTCGISAAFVGAISLVAQDDSPRYTVAFKAVPPSNTDIFVAAGDGTSARPLAADPALDYNASFSPDGRWIVFTSHRAGSADLYRIRLDGTGLERLTDDPAFDDQATFSPDGERLAFVSTRRGQADIWTLDLESRKTHLVIGDPAGDFRPAWSPDGEWIAFSSDRAASHEVVSPHDRAGPRPIRDAAVHRHLRRPRPTGRDVRRITACFRNDVGGPRWSPDGISPDRLYGARRSRSAVAT